VELSTVCAYRGGDLIFPLLFALFPLGGRKFIPWGRPRGSNQKAHGAQFLQGSKPGWLRGTVSPWGTYEARHCGQGVTPVSDGDFFSGHKKGGFPPSCGGFRTKNKTKQRPNQPPTHTQKTHEGFLAGGGVASFPPPCKCGKTPLLTPIGKRVLGNLAKPVFFFFKQNIFFVFNVFNTKRLLGFLGNLGTFQTKH